MVATTIEGGSAWNKEFKENYDHSQGEPSAKHWNLIATRINVQAVDAE